MNQLIENTVMKPLGIHGIDNACVLPLWHSSLAEILASNLRAII